MPSANRSQDAPSDVLPHHWSLWSANAIWRDKLARRATHKALNIPEEDVQIVQTTGMGWKELLTLGLLAAGLLAGQGLFLSYALRPPAPAVAPAPGESAAGAAAKARVEVYWGDQKIEPGKSLSAEVGP